MQTWRLLGEADAGDDHDVRGAIRCCDALPSWGHFSHLFVQRDMALLRLQVEDLAVASPATARVPGKAVARLRPVAMPMIDKGIGLDTSPK